MEIITQNHTFFREEQHIVNVVVNNLVPPGPSCNKNKLIITNDDLLRIQNEQFKSQIFANQFIANDNIQTVIKSFIKPVKTTTIVIIVKAT